MGRLMPLMLTWQLQRVMMAMRAMGMGRRG
jgi:hypothetical protein